MLSDLGLIIRSIGERTTEACIDSVRRECGDNQLAIIRERPFIKALRRSFEVGIESGCNWSLVLDADVILLPGAVHRLMAIADNSDKSVFTVQCKVLDKFFYSFRLAGIHLYRTTLLEAAIREIPEEGISLRPETYAIKQMQKKGYEFLYKDDVVGVHDFEQYFRDIFNKAFLHGKKHRRYKPYLNKLWHDRAAVDPDYLVALRGYEMGEKSAQETVVGLSISDEEINVILNEGGFREKGELAVDDRFFSGIKDLVNNYREPAGYDLYLGIQEGGSANRKRGLKALLGRLISAFRC